MFPPIPILLATALTAKEATQFFIKGVTAGTAIANVVRRK